MFGHWCFSPQAPLLFFLFVTQASPHQQWPKQQGCDTSCVLLRRCDFFLEKLRENNQNERKTVAQNACGRQQHRVKVCCPDYAPIQEALFPSTCGNNPSVAKKIVFGDETRMGEFPWAVALGYTGEHRGLRFVCSGTLINARYVLTAAHCVHGPSLLKHNLELSVLRLGDWNLETEEDCFESQNGRVCAPPVVESRPEKLLVHPTYNKEKLYADDIALIRLDKTIDFSKSKEYLMPVCLPSFGINAKLLMRNRDPLVIGWGRTEKAASSPILLKANVRLVDDQSCRRFYFSLFRDRQLCVGTSNSSSCQGDSGGPLLLAGPTGPPYLQLGIVSFGPRICHGGHIPGVYTSIGPYKNWIRFSMEPWQ